MKLKANKAFNDLCILEHNAPESIQSKIISAGLKYDIFKDDPKFSSKTILTCIVSANPMDVFNFIKNINVLDNITLVNKCVLEYEK